MTTLSELEYSPLIAQSTPVVSRALRTLSNVRVRNVATLGGHLAHGDPHMDLPPILMTLGGRVRATSRRGARWIDVVDLFVSYYQTALESDELITEVTLPAQPVGSHAWYEKFTALSADDWPAVGVAVYYRSEMGSGVIFSGHSEQMTPEPIIEARIAIGAATERPMRIPAAEAALVGSQPGPRAFANAAGAAAEAIDPVTDLRGSAAYKREMVRVHVRRALEWAQAAGRQEAR
jgi:carbon-monoxide dehydrogenase medium subunit